MPVYYNEIEPYPAQWLRNLIKAGHIPDGEVDERSIVDVRPEDLRGFDQCHFFAGIAGWSRALRLAGWPDDRPVWTGSCPCQPFSVAGRGAGTADARHLWPEFHRLIRECRPTVVFGEQVASKAGREWLSGVFADLEGVGYAGAGADLCAAGVGAPHIRQRLYWVGMADAEDNGRAQRTHTERSGSEDQQRRDNDLRRECLGSGPSLHSDMADAESLGWRGRQNVEDEGRREQPFADPRAGSGDVVDAESVGWREGWAEHELRGGRAAIAGAGSGDMADANDAGREGRAVHAERPDELAPWSRGVEWRRGADGKERRVKPGVCLLVDGVPNRVGRLRGFGNAIVPPLAAKVIEAVMEITKGE